MGRIIISFLLLFLLVLNAPKAQVNPSVSIPKPNIQSASILRLRTDESVSFVKTSLPNYISPVEDEFHSYTQQLLIPQEKHESPASSLVSSFRKNIHFGGYWNGYAIVNFTPNLFIQPADFISIYTNNSASMYVPIKGLRENMKILVVQGAAVMAAENAAKYFLSSMPIVQSLAGFVIKNLVLAYFDKVLNKDPTSIPVFKYYNCSVNIRF